MERGVRVLGKVGVKHNQALWWLWEIFPGYYENSKASHGIKTPNSFLQTVLS